jgi:hypothetical protein
MPSVKKKWLCSLGQWMEINDPLGPDDPNLVPEDADFEKTLERCQYKQLFVLGDDQIASGLIKVFSGTRPDTPPFMIELGFNSETVHIMYAANEPSMFMVLNLVVPAAHFDWVRTFEESKSRVPRCDRLLQDDSCCFERGHSGSCEAL